MDILERLQDLIEQATKERSHNYVAATCRAAIEEISNLRKVTRREKDTHLGNLIRQTREELQGNNAVRGYMRIKDVENYLKVTGYIDA